MIIIGSRANNHHHTSKLWMRLAVAIIAVGAWFVSPALWADDRCPATGGTLTVETVDGQLSCIHTFSEVGERSFSVPAGSLDLELLVVGGGGAGGQAGAGGGGGGAGGLLYAPSVSASGVISVVVGAGGSGLGDGGQNGANASFGALVAIGGGGGAVGNDGVGSDGGSGGGGSGAPDKGVVAAGAALQLPEFGHAGGEGRDDRKSEKRAGGGGGGASTVGVDGDAKKEGGIGGPGGDGLCAGGAVLPAWMDVVGDGCFGGGGGGTAHQASTHPDRAGTGGIGGGGDGEQPNNGGVDVPAGSGVVNTGGGGGGARNGVPGSGGSGVVLVRYLAATTLAVNAGNNQTGTVNAPLAQPLSVQVTNADGDPVGGVPVSFSVASGGGSIQPTTPVLTNASGVATLSQWTLGTVAGEQTLEAAVANVSGSPLTLTATANPGTPTRLGIKTQPAPLITNGVTFPTQPVIQILDTWGNIVLESGYPVSVAISSGGGTLGGTTTVNTDGDGLANFTNLSITGEVGQRQLTFSSTGMSDIVSNTLTLQAGAAAGLKLTQQPSSLVESGVVFAEQPHIQVVDQSGNAVAQAGVEIVASIAEGDDDATLNGDLDLTTNASGLVIYTDLSITGEVGDYRLGFAATGLSSVNSDLITVNSGAPSVLAITQQPSAEAREDEVFAQQPIIQLQDDGGNDVSLAGVNVTVAIASGAGTLSGPLTVPTNDSGQAVFTDLEIIGVVGERTLRFVAEGYASVTSTVINVVCGKCAKLAMITQPVDTQSGEALPTAPVVGQYDSAGNPTTTARDITVALAFGAGTLSGTTTVTSSGGQATFSDLVIEGATGPYAFTFSSENLASTQSDVFSVLAGDPDTLQQIAGDNQTQTVGQAVSIAPVVSVLDGAGNPVSGVSIKFEVTAGGGTVSPTTVVTNAEGQAALSSWTLGTSTGEQTIKATTTAIDGAVVNWTATAVADVANAISLEAGNNQTADAGSVLPIAPSVKVVDQYGNPVPNVGVEFSLTGGGGSIIGASPQTAANGVAAVGQWRLGDVPGVNTLTASVTGLIGSPVTFSATGVVGPPARLVIAQQPIAGASGQALTTQPIIHITDQVGNLTNSTETIEAILSYDVSEYPSGTLSGTRILNAVNGVVPYTDLVVTGAVGAPYQIEFSNETLSSVTSEPLSLSPGPPAELQLLTQPSPFVVNGETFPIQPVVQVLDASGNAVPTAGIEVSVAIATGGGLLSGTPSVNTDGQGRATFTDLAITGEIGQRTLSFSASGLSAALSNTVTVQVGPASGLRATGQPSSQVQSGVPFVEQPKIQVTDQSGNPVAEAGIEVRASLLNVSNSESTKPSGGQTQSATLLGDVMVVTDAEGLANFVDLAISAPEGDYQLRFDAPGLAPFTSSVIRVNAGPPQTLAIIQQPPISARHDEVFATPPIIALRDGAGNPAEVAGVAISVSISSGASALLGTTTLSTDASGQAVFDDLKIQGPVGLRTLRFVAEGYASVTSSAIDVVCGKCAKLALISQPSQGLTGQRFDPPWVVGQYDSAGNPTTTPRAITATLVTGFGELSGTVTVMSFEGQAVFDDLFIQGEAGLYALAFSTPEVASARSDLFVVEVPEPEDGEDSKDGLPISSLAPQAQWMLTGLLLVIAWLQLIARRQCMVRASNNPKR